MSGRRRVSARNFNILHFNVNTQIPNTYGMKSYGTRDKYYFYEINYFYNINVMFFFILFRISNGKNQVFNLNDLFYNKKNYMGGNFA